MDKKLTKGSTSAIHKRVMDRKAKLEGTASKYQGLASVFANESDGGIFVPENKNSREKEGELAALQEIDLETKEQTQVSQISNPADSLVSTTPKVAFSGALRRGSFTEKRTPVESSDHNGGFLKVSQNSGSEIDDKSSYAGDDIVGAEDFRKELERLQIATIYSLVERVPVKGGREINLLFLTNGQASEFNFTDMDKVMNAMDIKPRPKLIVSILKSMAHCGATSYTDSSVDPKDLFSFHLYVAEKDSQEYAQTDRRMATFLKEHLLPVCIKTNALVLLHDSTCAMSEAFGQICSAERKKRNGVLPFTVLAIIGAHNVACRAENDEESRARTIRRGSRRWRMYNNQMMDVFGQKSSKNEYRADFPAGITHGILISAFDEDKMKENSMPHRIFKTTLVDRLSRDLPSIALVSFSRGGDPISFYADYVGRQLPLILVDSRPPPTSEVVGSDTETLMQAYFERAQSHLSTIEYELKEKNTWNFYDISTLAFLHQQVQEFSAARLALGNLDSAVPGDSKKKKWLYMAIKDKQKATEMEGSEGPEETNETKLARKFVDLMMNSQIQADQIRRSFAIKVLDSFLEAAQKCQTIESLDILLKETTADWAQSNFFVGPENDDMGDPIGGYNYHMFYLEYPYMFEKLPFFRDGRVFSNMVGVRLEDDGVTLEAALEACKSLILGKRELIVDFKSAQMSTPEYMASGDMFSSPFVYSGNLQEPSRLASALAKIAKIDRLPPDNSLSGLNALRYAWDAVDVCNQVADKMKLLTKISYTALLVLGIAIGSLTVIHLNKPNLISESFLNYATAVLALFSGLITGVISTINPSQKWTRLRGAALTIESETWKFRTRSGIYVENGGDKAISDDSNNDNILKNRSESIKLQVLKSAGVLNTYFMSLFEIFEDPAHVATFRHGQYKDSGVQGTFGKDTYWAHSNKASADTAKRKLKSLSGDDFHSPCRPTEYLNLRVKKSLAFYQSRLPTYYRTKSNIQMFLLIGTFSGVILALLNIASWAAIFTGVTGAVTAWSEFHGTEDKITRYSDVITQIDSTVLWWKMLTPVDQSSINMISELVERCESVFRDERQAWVSLNIEQKAQTTPTKAAEESPKIESNEAII